MSLQDEKAGEQGKFAEELDRMVNKMNQAQVGWNIVTCTQCSMH